MLQRMLRQAEQPVEATLKARERRTASTQGSCEQHSRNGADQSPALMRNTQITALRQVAMEVFGMSSLVTIPESRSHYPPSQCHRAVANPRRSPAIYAVQIEERSWKAQHAL